MTQSPPAQLHSEVFAAATRNPRAAALIQGDTTLTYAELHQRVAALSDSLTAHGVAPGHRVACRFIPGSTGTSAVIAVLNCGASYVPIDPKAAPQTARSLTQAAECHWFLSDQAPEHVDIHSIGDLAPSPIPIDSTSNIHIARLNRRDEGRNPSLSYILHTSGSTGQPKGVCHTHSSAAAFVDWAVRFTQLRSGDQVAGLSPYQFDLSTFDIFATLSSGATLVYPASPLVFPADYINFMTAHAITIWYGVPSLMSLLVHRCRQRLPELNALRHILFAGEVMPPHTLQTLMSALPTTQFANLYGPTETNVCTAHPVTAAPADNQAIPIGRSASGAAIRVERPDRTPCRLDEAGELVISGPSLMAGYWPPDAQPPAAYRSGDLVHIDRTGTLHFHGRADTQVKIAGHRVELGAMEHAINNLEHVIESCVTTRPHPVWTAEAIAWVASAHATPAHIRQQLETSFPAAVVPTDIRIVDQLPHLPNGKVDRALLNARSARA